MFSTKKKRFHSDFYELLLAGKKEEKKDEDINEKFLAWVKDFDILVKNFSDSYFKAISCLPVRADDKKERDIQIKKIESFLKNSIVEKYLSLSEEYDEKNADCACRPLVSSLGIIVKFIRTNTDSKFPFLANEIDALERIEGNLRKIIKNIDVANKLGYVPPTSTSVASK